MDNEQKTIFIAAVKCFGTLKAGAKVANVGIEAVKQEMKKHAVFRKRVQEALKEGRENITDEALDKIREYVMNPPAKTDRNQLTAAIALANAYLPGFKGTSKVEGRIEHDVRVISAVPRPNYDQIEAPKKITIEPTKEDKDKLKALNAGTPINTIEDAVNEVVEGEIVNDN
ncbi:MAG: hypothetical protein PHS34_09660 [Candidatus Omnitrophica bacterium]|nr:hypothetical protein [Candidatus Omnitrophota bacterium]